MNRKADKARLHHLYDLLAGERAESGLYWLCVYCGAPAECRDHVPPLSRVDDYRALGVVEKYYLVPACLDCNKQLGNSLQETLLDRINEMKDKLERKMSKRFVEWDEEEIDELGKLLRSHVVTSNKRDRELRRRVDYWGGFDAILEQI